MRVWLVNIGEEVPIDPGNPRLRRMGILADVLSRRGDEVLWWSSTFHHILKTQRYSADTLTEIRPGYRLYSLFAPPYMQNISLNRLRNHRVVGRKFRTLARKEMPPDVILCSFPTLELSAESVAYGHEAGVPVVLDIRDMWPDIFVQLAPRWARSAAKLAAIPLYRLARKACRGAFAISGHAPAFVDWGLALAGRPRRAYDRDFPFGYVVRTPEEGKMLAAMRFWEERGVRPKPGSTIVCFFGIIGHQFNLKTVIEAARRLQGESQVQFVLCGEGNCLEHYRSEGRDCSNVVFPGWVGIPEIQALMRMSSYALTPYVDRADFAASISNKSIEYLAGGLPVLTSLSTGIFYDLLKEHQCGLSYGGRVEELARILKELSGAPARRTQMAENASRLFERRFQASRVYGAMADYLHEIALAYRQSGSSEELSMNETVRKGA